MPWHTKKRGTDERAEASAKRDRVVAQARLWFACEPNGGSDGVVDGDDSEIDNDTINNPRDPNPVVPNDPSEALPGDDDESSASEGVTPGEKPAGLIEEDPASALLLILLMLVAAAIGAFPASAAIRARREKKKQD